MLTAAELRIRYSEMSNTFPPIDLTSLTESDWELIDQGANGVFSGRLYEWPEMIAVLEKAGLSAVSAMHARTLYDICRLLMALKEKD